jgi:adenylate cyclase
MTTTGVVCGSCGIELPQNAKFCLECGAAVSTSAKSAEYKQVTVLFADVVHSMDIAASVGAERLREIMAGSTRQRTPARDVRVPTRWDSWRFRRSGT